MAFVAIIQTLAAVNLELRVWLNAINLDSRHNSLTLYSLLLTHCATHSRLLALSFLHRSEMLWNDLLSIRYSLRCCLKVRDGSFLNKCKRSCYYCCFYKKKTSIWTTLLRFSIALWRCLLLNNHDYFFAILFEVNSWLFASQLIRQVYS